jgi:phosphohistidine swiveling domain-containing protein
MLNKDRPELILTGQAATPIDACGPPIWLRSPLPPPQVAIDRILLLTDSVGPGIISLLYRCRGLVCESSVPTAHAVILAREIGAPCMFAVAELQRVRGAKTVCLRSEENRIIARWT